MQLPEFVVLDHAEMITPIGLSFGCRHHGADLFILEVIGDKDSPIRLDGRMIALADVSLCRSALETLKSLLPASVRIEHQYDFLCDIPTAIRVVTDQDNDHEAVVLNCINTLLDFVATGNFDLPDEYRILRALADRLTFRKELGEFMQTRSLIRNALVWCAGMVSLDITLIQSLSEFETLLARLTVNVNR